ncbi:putative GST-like protein YibF [compost metagenome]
MAELNASFDIAAISVACALGYLDFRMPTLDWRSQQPQLAKWYAEVSQRPSLKATEPPAA